MTHLKEGDPAPPFTGKIETGETVSLSDYKGKKLVLFFYPKDLTPGCTAEACSLRDHYQELKDEKKHQKFIEKKELPFHLLADTDKEVLKAYGVWGPKKFMGKSYTGVIRTTFVIDENGKIAKIFTKVKTKVHAEQILEAFC